jgi:hypothetical protein
VWENVAPEIREKIPGISLIGNKSQEFLLGINPRNFAMNNAAKNNERKRGKRFSLTFGAKVIIITQPLLPV